MISLAPELITLLNTVTSIAAGLSVPINVEGRDEIAICFQSNGTTSGGTLKIEEAFYPKDGPVYAGTWSQVGSDVSASAFTGTAQQVYHISPNSYQWIRVRISGAITGGGSVTVYAKLQ